MSLRASKLDGITSDENTSAVDLFQKKKEIEAAKPVEKTYDKENLLDNI